MACPHPLDPLCVAVMLRLTNGPTTEQGIADDLEISREALCGRLHRLSMLGAIELEQGHWRLLPEAHRIILEISTSGLNKNGHARSVRDEANYEVRLKRLKQEAMFQTLPEDELQWLARVSRTQCMAPGELLLLEGDECRALYIVDRGTIRLSKSSSSHSFGFGREQTIRLMVPGDSFNEVPVFDDGPNPVTAEALDDACVIVVPKRDVQDLVSRSPEFAGVIIKIMSQRLRHMIAMIEDVSMRDVTGRVAKILLQIQQPTEGVGAGVTLGRRLTQREIAEMAGTAREVVARALKKMERTGAVSIKRGNVQIIDAELLESFT
jgi:CRP-like cAMP-binding protein/biotin operon repressor